MRSLTHLALLLGWTLSGAALAQPAQLTRPDSTKGAPAAATRQLNLAVKPWTGDFDAMVERRMIRMLVPYSRTLYFNDKGTERGLTAELARDFERYINRKYVKDKRPITVLLIPTTREQLLPKLAQGLGDIAAGNLTVTEERLKIADFVAPADYGAVSEVVVTGARSAPIAAVEDLGGKTVHVRKSSSYHESLVALNERLRREKKPEVKLTIVPDALEDEDMMEMANAGLIDYLVVDDWKAKMWAQILPKVQVRERIAVRESGRRGWAIRKQSPQLAAAIQDAYVNVMKMQGLSEQRLVQYMRRVKQMKDPTKSADYKRFEQTLALFEKYGQQYGFDPLMLAAQGYQESTLDQKAKSPVGAIGVMQLMPATGAEMKVGDVAVTEANIHAGTKYMDILMTKYFPGAHFSESARPLFAFAAYNCGPGNMARMRKEAVKRGLDPDKWFDNVEVVVAEKIGVETTTYVRNIYKYYVSYKLTMEALETQRKARESLGKPP